MTVELSALSRRRFLHIAAAAAAMGLAGCAARPPVPTPSTDRQPEKSSVPHRLESAALRRAPGDPAQAGPALAAFGAAFLHAMQANGNALISPYSLFTVLAMARAGAKGETAAQLDALLGLDGAAQGAAITAVDTGITEALDSAKRSYREITVTAANESWVQEGVEVQQSYLDELAQQFGVGAVAADFADNPEAMRGAINSWVSERTNSLIPELFPRDSILIETKVVLVNALYLKAPWSQPFFPVSPAAFTTPDGGTVQTPMMSFPGQLDGTTGDGWTAVTVPYAGNGLTMTLLVPDTGRFAAVFAALDAGLIGAAAGTTQRFELTMPPFKIDSTPDAKQIVEQLGLVDIFQDGIADLSGIAGVQGWLFANTFVHQATISVDESGTEAAAATGMGMMASGAPAPAPRLVIDRPFLFWIAETSTGAPLFLGAVTNPLG